ncbi:hypothetical protein I0E98_18130 [Pseudomonas lalucatii]|nr:hypothetical protein [Pseudomonas lalucatii]
MSIEETEMANFIKSDLEFILQQILIAEANANGEDLLSLLPNTLVPFGLRTVDGSFNNLLTGQTEFGAADNTFPRLLDPVFRPAEGGTSYTQTSGMVIDSQPRTISNLIVDQTITNPAAVQAFVDAGMGVLADGSQQDAGGIAFPVGTLLDLDGNAIPAGQSLFIPNTAPDEGLSAPSTAGSPSSASSSTTASTWCRRAAAGWCSFHCSRTIR